MQAVNKVISQEQHKYNRTQTYNSLAQQAAFSYPTVDSSNIKAQRI